MRVVLERGLPTTCIPRIFTRAHTSYHSFTGVPDPVGRRHVPQVGRTQWAKWVDLFLKYKNPFGNFCAEYPTSTGMLYYLSKKNYCGNP